MSTLETIWTFDTATITKTLLYWRVPLGDNANYNKAQVAIIYHRTGRLRNHHDVVTHPNFVELMGQRTTLYDGIAYVANHKYLMVAETAALLLALFYSWSSDASDESYDELMKLLPQHSYSANPSLKHDVHKLHDTIMQAVGSASTKPTLYTYMLWEAIIHKEAAVRKLIAKHDYLLGVGVDTMALLTYLHQSHGRAPGQPIYKPLWEYMLSVLYELVYQQERWSYSDKTNDYTALYVLCAEHTHLFTEPRRTAHYLPYTILPPALAVIVGEYHVLTYEERLVIVQDRVRSVHSKTLGL